MKLVLSVKSGSEPVENEVTINTEQATIGRNPESTLVLEDPQRFISGRHAVIDYRTTCYFITDTSSNGLLINSLKHPIGNGNSTKLKNGDRIHIGDYTVSVRILDEQNSTPITNEPPKCKSINISEDPFRDLDNDLVQEMIDNPLLPSEWSNHKNIEKSSDTVECDHIDSNLNLNVKTDRQEIKPLHEVNVVFQPVKQDNHKQKSTIPDDWYTQDQDQKNHIPSKENTPENVQSGLSKPVVTSQHKTPSNISDNQAIIVENFLRGLGLENDGINDSLTPETFYIIGKILRTSIQGTMDVLVGRAKIKNEMHMDPTMIRPRQNNPVKFSVSANEAIRKLLAPQDAGYLPAEEALEEAFDDIRAHQFSVIAGMEKALLEVLMRFDPQKLEQRLQEKSPISASIPIHRKAKLWSLFEHQYDEIERETSDNFYRLFGKTFAESYEQQMIKLRNSKKDNSF